MTPGAQLEKIARAICKSRTCEGASCCQWPANRGRAQCPVAMGGYYDAAVAALDALLTEMGDDFMERGTGNRPGIILPKPVIPANIG